MIDRVNSCVHQFRHEHKIFKGPFIFKGHDYQEYCQKEYEEISAFIADNKLEEFAYKPLPQAVSRPIEEIEFKSQSSPRNLARASDFDDKSTKKDAFVNTLKIGEGTTIGKL